ncbi:vanadium-dependent haloperoxidase [Paraflavitalea pollutisoli]|uniref:vanadium-dependent haloperoxidase n=1 Tax=Paraflavitalea pollutisoli TaxID=3034143 RepID=UPI0023EBB4A4|nr:phosphatase PAP2 family protein [Paraflavitalea sp. H1-2-19X]
MLTRFILLLSITLGLASCQPATTKTSFASTHISQVITRMTDVMIHDITNPPLAARFFSYACLAGYEVLAQNDSTISPLPLIINGYPTLVKPDSLAGYHTELSALLAMLETAKKMQPSGKMIGAYEQQLLDSCRAIGMSEEELERSQQYAGWISKQVLAYAKGDRYSRISNFPRYTPLNEPGYWFPTAPAYMPAVEPYFNTVRPFMLDSASQFIPPRPIPFSTSKQSDFYALMMRNYTVTKDMPQEYRVIAAFWDCNPFAVQDGGHLVTGLKKISPGAHWLGITGIACLQEKKSFSESLQIYTMVSMGLMDAFITCWDEKFRSNRIRPESAIRQLVDPQWQPLLQTPPFPEYLSGHSVISSASATILSHYFGNHFGYKDSVEVSYGLPARSFTSFRQAADEAAVSRFYGGIHFMDAIDNGVLQGNKVGDQLLSRVARGKQ